MKRFEVAIEISKQLITLCSALIVGIAALTSNILSNESSQAIVTMLVAQYVLYFLSIISGIFHIGAVANLIETTERRDFNLKANASIESKEEDAKFVSMFDNALAPIFCSIQQWLFILGVLLLIVTVVTDWNMNPQSPTLAPP